MQRADAEPHSGVPHATVIVNPASGRGRGARMLPGVRSAFARHGITDIRLTESRGDEARVVAAALAAGAATIAVAGGDGTWGRCANAVLAAGAGERVRLAFITAGTGNDFAKNLGAPTHDLRAMAALVADPLAERRVDAGAIECDGTTHWFLNVAGFGFDVAVLEDVMRGGSLSGHAVYIVAALRRLIGYSGFEYVERGGGGTRRAMMLLFSNGMHFGGAFRIAPSARVDDGLLDRIHVGDVRGLARVPLFLRALRGAHLADPEVHLAQRRQFEVTFDAAPPCDLDGELIRLPARDLLVRVVPGALRVAAPGPLVHR